jgi:predicted transcriptional regulator
LEDRVIDAKDAVELCRTHGSENRIQVPGLSGSEKIIIDEIAEKSKQPQSSVSTNKSILEKSGLITVKPQSGKRESGNYVLPATPLEKRFRKRR